MPTYVNCQVAYTLSQDGALLYFTIMILADGVIMCRLGLHPEGACTQVFFVPTYFRNASGPLW